MTHAIFVYRLSATKVSNLASNGFIEIAGVVPKFEGTYHFARLTVLSTRYRDEGGGGQFG
jgi:hypothetical protein